MIAFAGYDDINKVYLIFCIHIDNQLMLTEIEFIVADYYMAAQARGLESIVSTQARLRMHGREHVNP
jgi:hypothetical protein